MIRVTPVYNYVLIAFRKDSPIPFDVYPPRLWKHKTQNILIECDSSYYPDDLIYKLGELGDQLSRPAGHNWQRCRLIMHHHTKTGKESAIVITDLRLVELTDNKFQDVLGSIHADSIDEIEAKMIEYLGLDFENE